MFERNVGLQLFEGNIESEHIHFLGTEQAQPRTLRQRINQTAYDPLVQSAGLCHTANLYLRASGRYVRVKSRT